VRFGVPGDPAVVDLPDRDRIEVVELLAALLVGDDQVRPLEDPEVLHHTEAGHLGERVDEGAERPTVVVGEQVEQ
jgi:hypothetical protein